MDAEPHLQSTATGETSPLDHSPLDYLSPAVTAALSRAFDLGTPTGRAVLADQGEQGRIWRLDTDRGTWAVKQALHHTDEARAAVDLTFQETAAAAGVPLPRPVRTSEGAALLDGASLPDGGADGAFRAFAWVDLDPEARASAEDFGRIAAALHRLDLPAAPEEQTWWGDVIARPEWAALLDAGRRAGEPWAPTLEVALPDLLAMGDLVTADDPAALRTCHRDLSVLNVRRTRGGGLTVLDWENSGPAEPVRELAVLLVVFTLEYSAEDAVALYEAYVAAGGPARIRALADFSAVASGGHGLVRLYAGQTLDSATPQHVRAFARERLGWMLSGPMLPIVTDLFDRTAAR